MTKLYKTQEICQPYANLTSLFILFILFIVFIPYNCHNLTEMDPEAGGDGKARDPYAAQSCRACRACRAWVSGVGRGEIWCPHVSPRICAVSAWRWAEETHVAVLCLQPWALRLELSCWISEWMNHQICPSQNQCLYCMVV